MDGPQEVASGLAVARSNDPGLLQACEEVLDQMQSLVEVAVISGRQGASGSAHWCTDRPA